VPVALTLGRGELLNLLEGQRYAYEVRGGATVVHLDLAPHDIGLLPLKPLPQTFARRFLRARQQAVAGREPWGHRAGSY